MVVKGLVKGLCMRESLPYNPRPRWVGAERSASDSLSEEGPVGAFVFLDRRYLCALGRFGRAFGPFFVGGRLETALHDRLIARFEPVLKDAGYELVEVEFVMGPGGGTLRVYIDSPEGIDLDDCAEASHLISELLDADDPFPGAYSLEVSSPGLDRVLRTPEHFARFVDNRVKVELRGAARRAQALHRGAAPDGRREHRDGRGQFFREHEDRGDCEGETRSAVTRMVARP